MNVDELHDKIIAPAFKRFDGKLDKLYDKLFEDNGGDCFQTKVDRNTRWRKAMFWIITTFIAILLAIAKIVM